MFIGLLGLLAGLILLFAGKRFFWLMAGLVGFLFAWSIVGNLFGTGWLAIILGLVLALVLGWLAVQFVKIAAYIIGLAAGAFILPALLGLVGIHFAFLLEALIGGVIGLLLMMFFLEWGLILLTALMGASAVGGGLEATLGIGPAMSGLVMLALFVAGVIVQARNKDSG